MTKRRMCRRLLAGAVVVAAVCGPRAAAAATCADLLWAVVPGSEITRTAVVAPGAFLPPGIHPSEPAAARFSGLPEFCRVTATLRPSADSEIRIEVWLPSERWNGRFMGVGNGTWAGVIPYASLAGALRAGYASAGTDGGHVGDTAAFAAGHPEKVVDMAHRAVHEMTMQAKALVAAYYEQPPVLSVWSGCSTGGRQGITAAARYPGDFDAVIAGAPAVNWVHLHAGRLALHQAVNRTQAHVIPPEKYPLIGRAVIQACDGLDGVVDGVLETPRACRFDPKVLECRGGNGASCLTPPQVDAARAFYEPVRHPVTGAIVMPGLEFGTEQSWGILGGASPLGTAVEAFQFAVFKDPAWDWRRFDLAADLDAAMSLEEVAGLDSSDTDLRPYFDRGGKLLMYHGWSDAQIPAANTTSFFERAMTAAGPDGVGRSIQLYMVPGMNHCGGGGGTDVFDSVGAMNEWLRTGQAPLRITAARIVNGLVERTRPLCPFGQVARWNGVGNPNEASAFACVADATQIPGSR